MRLKIKGTLQKASGFFQTKKFLSKKFLFIFFAVAIIATAGVSVPAHSADAVSLGGVLDKITNIGGSLKNFMDTFESEGLGNTLARMLYAVVVVVLRLVLMIVAYLAYFGAWLIDIMLSPGLAQGVLESDAIDTGWKTVRDMCNTFFIFFMLLIAFSTILRIQKYGSTKSLLSKFIISIFLINFSMVIAKIIIDAGQVFMYEIKDWMGMGFSDCGGSLTSIVEKFKRETATGWQASFEDIIRVLFAIIYTVMLGLVFIMLAGFLLFRLVAFAILIVLSPFAFLSIVLPSMSKYTSEWFDTLIKYSIFGPVFLFFVYLSATMANELVLVDYTVAGVPAASADMSAISGMIGNMVSHAVALAMLWAVIPVTQRLGVAGSQQLIGGAMGMGKIAIGTYGGIKLAGGLGKKAAAPVARRTGLTDKYRTTKSRALQKVSENKLAQNIGLGKSATQTNASDFKRQRDEVDKSKVWAKQGSPKSRWAALQAGSKTSAETAAIIEVMIEKKELNKKDAEEYGIKGDKLDSVLVRARSSVDMDKLKESMPHWAAATELGSSKDKEAVNKRTVEMVKENVSEGKLGSLNRAAMQDATVINTIRTEHDDFDKWTSSQSATNRGAIAVGLEGGLQDIQKALIGSGEDINTVDGPAVVAGKEGKEWRKEIDSIQKSLAKNDKDGHLMLNRPSINAASGEIEVVDGRINFAGAPTPAAGTPEHVAWERRRKEFAGGMKGESNFKNKNKEFYTEMGQYLASAQLDTLRKAGSTEQMKEAKNSIVVNLPAGSPTRDYVENHSDYYKDL